MSCLCGYSFCYFCGEKYEAEHTCNKTLNCSEKIRWNLYNVPLRFFETRMFNIKDVHSFFSFEL